MATKKLELWSTPMTAQGAESRPHPAGDGEYLAFDEFQLLFESAERVTDRRHSMNRWNYSICVAIVTGVMGIVTWSTTHQEFFGPAIIAIIVLATSAILFCIYWRMQIVDFKRLNSAKFVVLNEMAPNLVFSESPSDSRRSFRPFEREWGILSESSALTHIGPIHTPVLRGSLGETLLPNTFVLIFFLLAMSAAAAAVANWDLFRDSISLTISESSSA